MLKKIIGLIFRFIYYLLYHQFAWSYDFVAALVSLGRWNSWVNYAQTFLSQERVLEIGSGPGHLLLSSMRSRIDIVGLDESRQMTERASKLIKSGGYSPAIIRGNIYSLPFKDSHFNQVVATFPSEYILNSTAISEINRILTTSGQLIILPFAWIKGKLWYEKIIGRLFDPGLAVQLWDEKYCPIISQQGFEINTKVIEDYGSIMFFITATKQNKFSNRTES